MIGTISDFLSSESFFFSIRGGVGLETMTGGGAELVDSSSLYLSFAELTFDKPGDSGSDNDTAESLEINDMADGVGEGDGVCIEDIDPIIGLEAELTNPG